MASSHSITRLTRLAAVAALIIALTPPLVLLYAQYRYQQAAILVEAEVSSKLIGEIVNKNPELWVFEQLRLEDLLGWRPKQGNRLEVRRIYSNDNKLIAEQADTLIPPLITESAILFSAGRPVGRVVVSRSLWSAITEALALGFFSFLLGVAVFISIKTIPLRSLRLAFLKLEEEKERALVTLQSIGDAVVTTDAQMRIEYFNPVAEHLMGWSAAEAKGLPIHDVFNIVREATREPAVNPIQTCIEHNKIVKMENHTILIRKADKVEFHIEDSAAPIRMSDGAVIGAVMVFHDVSERRRLQKDLNHIAYHDALTTLPNRALFQARLAQAIVNARRVKKDFAVLFLDLDRFKVINDSLGHDAGDQLLVQVAERLRSCVRSSDLVARMGGDEFTAVLEGIGGNSVASDISSKMLELVARPYDIDGQELFITTSIGIAIYPADGEDVETLLKNADAAMYKAKYSGRNSYHFYVPNANEHAVDKMHFENALNKALAKGEFFLEYQPQLDLQKNAIVGVEALVRWNSVAFGRVSPAQFIPLLEESGLIVEVGEWILNTAITQAKVWLDSGHPISIAVNFSARQFWQAGLVDMVARVLSEHDFPPALLEMEITESLIMENMLNNEKKLAQLQALGVQISLDDFGTGYSSLSHLRRLPINILKIDKSFVDDLSLNVSAVEIVNTIIALGNALDIRVIAEGVETEEQYAQLKESGCGSVQGFWFSRPMPAADVLTWLNLYSAQ